MKSGVLFQGPPGAEVKGVNHVVNVTEAEQLVEELSSTGMAVFMGTGGIPITFTLGAKPAEPAIEATKPAAPDGELRTDCCTGPCDGCGDPSDIAKPVAAVTAGDVALSVVEQMNKILRNGEYMNTVDLNHLANVYRTLVEAESIDAYVEMAAERHDTYVEAQKRSQRKPGLAPPFIRRPATPEDFYPMAQYFKTISN